MTTASIRSELEAAGFTHVADLPRVEPRKGVRLELTKSRRALLDVCREIQFGRIENLVIQNGQPVWEPEPTILQQVRIDPPQKTRSVASPGLPWQAKRALEILVEVDEGMVTIEVKEGLPWTVTRERKALMV